MLRRHFSVPKSKFTSCLLIATLTTPYSATAIRQISFAELLPHSSNDIKSAQHQQQQIKSLYEQLYLQKEEGDNNNIKSSSSPSSATSTTTLFSQQQHSTTQQPLPKTEKQNNKNQNSQTHVISVFEQTIAQKKTNNLKLIFENDISAMRDSVCILLRAFCATGQVSRARELFAQFLTETKPRERSTAVFDTWLQLLVQQATINKQEVLQILSVMEKESNLSKTAFTYQSLIEAHIRLQLDPSPLYYEMKTHKNAKSLLSPSVLSLLVKGVAPFRTRDAEVACPQFHVDVLRDYLAKARPLATADGTTSPNSLDYNLDFLKQRFLMFINNGNNNNNQQQQQQQSYNNNEQLYSPESALWLLFEIEQRCVIECVSLREVIERAPLVQLLLKCAKCGDADTAAGVVALMERHLIPKSVDVLALSLWAQAVAGRIPDAFDTLQDMVRRGYLDHVDHTRRFVVEALGVPMECHYLTTLADSLNTVEAVDRAYFYLEARHKKGLPVSIHALDTVVLACGKIGDENRAVETLEAYPSLFGIQPRIQSYNALLLSCTGKNKARRHRTVFEAIRRRGISPNYHTMRILIRQAVLCNNIEEALSYLEQAKNTPGIRIDVEMILSIFERSCKVGDLETALHVSKMALECDIGIDAGILRVGCDRLGELGVDSTALAETISVHEKLRGRHGLGRRN